MTRPLVSIIIPTRNSARFLAEALDSVHAQSCKDYEIVLVDGHSTDATLEIASRYEKTHIIPQQSQGLGGAWNEGLRAAQGTLIAFLDSDDLWAPRKLELQAAYLVRHPEVELVATRMHYFLSAGEALPPAFNRPGLLDTDHASYFPGNLLIRKRLFSVVGEFNASLKIASDLDWFARVKNMHISAYIMSERLYYKRIHSGNLSHGDTSRQVWSQELLKVMKESVRQKKNKIHVDVAQ
jgi:glycosyltransferase involved in cell wall biosynthesis